MSINFGQGLLYGFISGLTEFLPISSQAHQALLRQMFGMVQRDPVLDFVVHGALLSVLLYALNTLLQQMRRIRVNSTRSAHFSDQASRTAMNAQLVKNAVFPMLLVMLLLFYITKGSDNLLITAVFLLINGLVLFLPSRLMQGNKDVRSMSYLDSLLLGVLGACGAICGISRIAVTTSVSVSRGADRHNALNWSLMLSLYAIAIMMGYDLILTFSAITQIPFWSNFLSYFAAAAGALIGGYLSIQLIRALVQQSSLSNFAFYSWGLALLTFFMYLTVV